jgi:hypothetical protein
LAAKSASCSVAAFAVKSASGSAAAAAVTTDPGLVQPAAMSAATPPQAWTLEKRDGHVLMARRLSTKPLESPEMTRSSEGCRDLNMSTASWADERELSEDYRVMGSPPSATQQLQPRLQQQQWRIGWRKWRGRSMLS